MSASVANSTELMKNSHAGESLRKIAALLGPKILLLYFTGCLLGVMLGFIELALVASIQALLLIMGLSLQSDGQYFLDKYITSTSSVGVALLLIALARAATLFFVAQNSTYCGESVFSRLRSLMAYDYLLRDGGRFIPGSKLTHYFGDVFGKSAFVFNTIAGVVPLVIQLAILQAVMFNFSWQDLLLADGGVVVIGMSTYLIGRRIVKLSTKIPDLQHGVMRTIERTSRNWFLVKIRRTGLQEFFRIVGDNFEYCRVLVRNSGYSNVTSVWPSFLGILVILGIVLFDKTYVNSSPQALVGFVFIFIRFVQQLAGLNNSISQGLSFLSYFKMTIDYIQQFDASEITVARKFAGDLNFIGNGSFKSDENRSPAILSDDQNYRVVNPPGIELANVTFSYGDERPSVVEAFNLKVAPGEQVALIGPSGVGKSTVLSLILGVFDPNKGTVKIDGRAPNEFFEHCSDFVGYVGADPFVMAGTLLDNICYGHRRKYSESQIFEAIRSAQAEFLLECEGGLSYRLNENGDGLSAGQKQRLSLVRALLGGPTLLILDEATANLDQESELKIAEILKSKKGEMTVLIVSHRPGIIKYADNVVRLGSNQGPSSSV